MDKKEKLQNIWAMTDKELIEAMTKKRSQLSDTLNKEHSSDSDSDSKNDFIALPEEFRPNLNVNEWSFQETKQNAKISPSQSLKEQLIQSPNSAFRKPLKNKLSSRSPESLKFSFSESKQTLPIHYSNSQVLAKNDGDSSSSNTGSRPKARVVENTNLRQDSKVSNEIAENIEVVKRKVVKSPLSQKTLNAVNSDEFEKAIVRSNEPQNKKSLKYEYVQHQEQRTIQLNFDMLSLKDADLVLNDGVKYETKLVRNTRTRHENAAHMENRITARKSGNSGRISSAPKGQFPISSGESTIKWDSSLNLNCDDYNKIEWTVVREEKTYTVTAKKKITSELPQFDYEFVCDSNRRRSMNSPKEKFNTNLLQNETICNQNKTPKIIQKDKRLTDSRPTYNNNKNFAFVHNLNYDNKDNSKQTYSTAERGLSPELYVSDTEEDNYMERYRASEQETANNLFRSSSREVSNVSPEESPVDEQSYNIGLKSSSLNKKQNGFTDFQQTPNDLNHPENLGYYQRRYSNEKKSKELEEKRDFILGYGEEMSDRIIRSYNSLSILISFYREWTLARRELVFHFEQLEKNLKESSKRFSRFTDVIRMANSGAQVAASIPHSAVQMAAKIVSVITSLLQTFMKTSNADKANTDDSEGITGAMFKDTQTTAELYAFGLMCSQQFEETTKLIEKLHSSADIQGYSDTENPEISNFIHGFLDLKPNHCAFYKNLHKCYQELLRTSTNPFSRRFCDPFKLYSASVTDVIEFLSWRFRHEDFNGSSVRHELEGINRLIEDGNNTNLEDLRKRIQNCIRILREELEFMESCFKDFSLLFDFSDFLKPSHK